MHVLDDGFQHLQLDRDIDLVIVGREDVERPVTLPGGRLREPLDTLVAADAVLTQDEDVVVESPGLDLPVYRLMRSTPGDRGIAAEAAAGQPVLALAGIAAPQRFFDDLRGAGWNVVKTMAFRDHHRYDAEDLVFIAETAGGAGAELILTTEKDYVRLLPLEPLPLPIGFVPLTMQPEPLDEFRAWLAVRAADDSRAGRWLRRRASVIVSSTPRWPASCSWRGCCRCARCSPPARCSAARSTLFDRPHRRLAISNLQAAFPSRSEAECDAIARGMFAHFGRLLTVLLKFSTMPPEQMLARVEFEGEERVARGARAGPRRAAVHRALRLLGDQRARARAGDRSRWRCSRGRSTIRCCTICSSRCARRTGNSVIYRRGAIRRVLRALAANQAVAVLIDQHIQTADAVYVDFFNRPAATTSALAALALRTGAPVVPVFALPLPGGRFRMVYEHAVEPPTRRRSRGPARVHAALHRRARDVRAPLSGAVAVDAPPLA